MKTQFEWVVVERFSDPTQRSIKTVRWATSCPGYRFMCEPDPDPKFKGCYRVVYWGVKERRGPSIIKKHLRVVAK